MYFYIVLGEKVTCRMCEVNELRDLYRADFHKENILNE